MMFSRKHPYLFFLLVFAGIAAVALVSVAVLIAVAFRGHGYGGLMASGAEKVGVVEVTGMIADAKETLQRLRAFREDPDIKAIVLRIDSPGGGVGPSQEIFREVRKTVAEKTVIASMGAIAASGGYYIAAGASGIIANPGTVTGSIGVIIGYTNFRELLQKVGLSPVVIKSGQFKDIGSPTRQMTAEERELLQQFVDQTHQQFVAAVCEGRDMASERVLPIADGRIFSGQRARELGLVDRLGNLEDAIEWAGRKGGITGRIVPVYPPEKKLTLLKYLSASGMRALIRQTLHPELYAGYLYQPVAADRATR